MKTKTNLLCQLGEEKGYEICELCDGAQGTALKYFQVPYMCGESI